MSINQALASAQGRLVRALGAETATPPGFDTRQLRAMTRVLAGKRRRAVAVAYPSLRRGLASRFEPLFNEYVRERPLPRTEGAASDACGFLQWLRERSALPTGVHVAAVPVPLRGRQRFVIAWLGRERWLIWGWPAAGPVADAGYESVGSEERRPSRDMTNV